MPEYTSFRGARLKVDRSQKHVNDLRDEIFDFFKDDFCKVRIKPDTDAGKHIVQLETKPLPETFGLIIGDAIHNLRSALDLMVIQMIFEKTGSRPDHAKFPIFETKKKFESGVKGGNVRLAGEKFIRFLHEEARPYADEGGNEVFWALHTLDMLDKHEIIIPHIGRFGLPNLFFTDDRYNIFMVPIYEEAGKIITLGKISPHLKLEVQNDTKPAFNVFFDKNGPGIGKPVLPALIQLGQSVLFTINMCEAL